MFEEDDLVRGKQDEVLDPGPTGRLDTGRLEVEERAVVE